MVAPGLPGMRGCCVTSLRPEKNAKNPEEDERNPRKLQEGHGKEGQKEVGWEQ